MHLLVPDVSPAPALHRAPGNVVSILFRVDGKPVLLSEYAGGYYLKKLTAGGTRVDFVRVRGSDGAWLAGPQHVVVFPAATARLAGNVLLWADETHDISPRRPWIDAGTRRSGRRAPSVRG